MPKKERRTRSSKPVAAERAIALGGGLVGAQASLHQASATDAMVDGMDKFREMVVRVGNKEAKYRYGHLFETIIAAKENAALAKGGSAEHVVVNHLDGRHTTSADLEWRKGGTIMAEGQVKFNDRFRVGNTPKAIRDLAKKISDRKYQDMRLFVPADRVEQVRQELQSMAQDPAVTLQDRLRYEGAVGRVAEHDTTVRECLLADRIPARYALGNELIYVAREAVVTGAWASTSGALVGGGISLIKNTYLFATGDVSGEVIVKAVAVDAGKAGAHSGASGVVSAGIRYGAHKAGLNALTKSNVATAVAASVIDCGVTVWKFAEGEITAEEAVERIGQSGISTMSSIYAGAVAGAVFGPMGAVAGSIAGYLIASNLYQGCLTILKNARLAEEQAARITAICEESIRQMRVQREEFEALLEENIQIRRQEFARCFTAIDQAFESDSHESAIYAVGNFLGLFGKKLKFASFSQFDDFMLDSSEPLFL